MRQSKRISIIQKTLKQTKTNRKISTLFKYLFFLIKKDISQRQLQDLIDLYYKKEEEIYNTWKVYSDLRFTQVLVNFEIIPNYTGFWYNTEDEDLFINSGILKPRDICFWGVNYNKEGKRLKNTKYVLIKNLKKEHIKNILTLSYISEDYIKYLKNELLLRK